MDFIRSRNGIERFHKKATDRGFYIEDDCCIFTIFNTLSYNALDFNTLSYNVLDVAIIQRLSEMGECFAPYAAVLFIFC